MFKRQGGYPVKRRHSNGGNLWTICNSFGYLGVHFMRTRRHARYVNIPEMCCACGGSFQLGWEFDNHYCRDY